MSSLLEVDSVIISFGHRKIVSDCFLKCSTGEVIGILGRNGCGKSSLLKVIFGTLSTQSKFIRINGQVYQQPYKKGNLIAYLPQHTFLPQNISVKTIIDIFIADRTVKERILNDHRLKDHLRKRISELSGGELRYLEILILVNLDVKFILLDEPFSKVEPLYKQIIIDLIQEYRSTKGFIITDHDYSNIITASDKIILISNGICMPVDELIELEQNNYVPVGTFS